MAPVFVTLDEIKAVGLGTRFISILSAKGNTTSTIPQLWHAFIEQMPAVPHKVGNYSLGLVEMLPANAGKSDPEELFYLAAAPVSSFEDVPASFLKRVIPAGRYAKFTHVGKLDTLGKTMHGIYREWVPQSGMRLRNAPHLEWYEDSRFDPGSEKSELDILLPVE